MPLTPPLTDQGGSSGASGSNTSCQHYAQGGVLRVEPSDTDFEYHVQPLHGNLPIDEPFCINHAHLDDDRRGCGPMTLQYYSAEPGRLGRDQTAVQDSTRQSIWKKIRQLLPNAQVSDILPQVAFDECAAKGQTIDLIFNQTPAGKEAMDAFMEAHEFIETEKLGRNQWRSFYFLCWTNSLGGNILPFDVHRLPLDRFDPKDLFDGLARMASPVGTLLGMGNVVMKSSEWGVEGIKTGITRGYIQLSAKSMTLSFEELAHLLPTRFLWCGTAHSLYYSGHCKHATEVVSPDYGVLLGHDVGGEAGGIEGGGGGRAGGEDGLGSNGNGNAVEGGGGNGRDGAVEEESVCTPSTTPALDRSSNHHGNKNGAASSSSSTLAAKRRRTSRN